LLPCHQLNPPALLQEIFTALLRQYVADPNLISDLWNEIKTSYSHRNRHYHSLTHLENLYSELLGCRELIRDWDATVFAMFYHDAVYDVLRKDNEEKSAVLARFRLNEISFAKERIDLCASQIRATKSHTPDALDDVNYFTDADLSILGQPWDDFKKYSIQIRKEYSIIPTLIFNSGRKKVLRNFLEMRPLFKTQFFFRRYEEQARFNISKSLAEL
jgi:predicted metal-dependent HD superfamily phosphohydrolase